MSIASLTELQGLLDAVVINPLGGLNYQDPETRAPATLTAATATRFVEVVAPNLLIAGNRLKPSPFGLPAHIRPRTETEMVPSDRHTNGATLRANSNQGRRLKLISFPRTDTEPPSVEILVADVVKLQSHSYRAQSAKLELSEDEATVEKISGARRFVFQHGELDRLLTNNRISFDDNDAILALMTSAILGQLPQGANADEVIIQSAKIYTVMPHMGGSSAPRDPMTGAKLYTKKDIKLSDLDWGGKTQVQRGFVAEVTFVFGGRTLTARVRKYYASEFPLKNADFLSLSLTYSGFPDITPGIQGSELTKMDNALKDAFSPLIN